MPTSNPNNPMDKDAASRIQSATAKQGGDTGKESWAAKAQHHADTNKNQASAGASEKGSGGAGGGNNNDGSEKSAQGQGGSGGGGRG
ncbi:MAG: hypothetical protein LQ338_004458 [Usnochroma carphineum]|nr:MAG: hypothetical protein LQ338_004458 [Usnochroma carphineum]